MLELRDKLDKHSLAPAFVLADMTAFLLNPLDLDDHKYLPEERTKFHRRLVRDIEDV